MNPFVAVFERPVTSLTAGAYVLILLAALVGTWWAAVPNLLYLDDRFQDGWIVLVPGAYAARVIAVLLIVAVDLLLIAGIIGVLT